MEDVLCGLRSAVDAITARHRDAASRGAEVGGAVRPVEAGRWRPPRREDAAEAVSAASRAKAAAWRAQCEQLVGRAKRSTAAGPSPLPPVEQ